MRRHKRYLERGPWIFFMLTVIVITSVFVVHLTGTLDSFTKLSPIETRPVEVFSIREFNAKCSHNKTSINEKCNQRKTIIYSKENIKFVHYYNKPNFMPVDIFKGCKYKCNLTWKSTVDYDRSDAVIFHGPELTTIMKPPKKRNGQVWILHSKESPADIYSHEFPYWRSLFNWTISYRRDADILAMNGYFYEREKSKKKFNLTRISSKSKSIAWFVSNCNTPWERETFVKDLSSYNQRIDKFGRCWWSHECSRSEENSCMNILKKHYKFYLSFENALCHDYITEKSFKIYEKEVDVIPITRGIGEQYKLYLPPNSYINTINFESIKELSEFVKHIENNRGLWEGYHWWKKYYEAHIIEYVEFCSLCRRLHHQEKYKRLYSDFGSWKNLKGYKSVCISPDDIK